MHRRLYYRIDQARDIPIASTIPKYTLGEGIGRKSHYGTDKPIHILLTDTVSAYSL